jgi:hypothetical protein
MIIYFYFSSLNSSWYSAGIAWGKSVFLADGFCVLQVGGCMSQLAACRQLIRWRYYNRLLMAVDTCTVGHCVVRGL